MSRSPLDWTIEAEDHKIAEAADGSRVSRRAVWLIAAVLAVGMGAFVCGQVSQRIEHTKQAIRADVLSSHWIVQRAVERADADLAEAFIAGSPPGWADLQRELIAQGALYDRAGLGLRALGDDRADVRVTLSNDRKTALVEFERPFAVEASLGVTETVVRLRQASVYRNDGQRWRLSPPDAAFWGSPVRRAGRRLMLTYPQRDADIAERLGRDLETMLDRLCVDADCLDEFQMVLDLSRDAASLLALASPVPIPPPEDSLALDEAADRLFIVLPAPTLIGRPVDESAYQALYRGYAAALARRVLAVLYDPDDEPSRPAIPAAIDAALARLGLQPWQPNASVFAPPAHVRLPEQDIHLVCYNDGHLGGSLYRYRLADGVWTPEVTDRVFVSMVPLPADGGVLLQERRRVLGRARASLVLWQDGLERRVFDRPTGGVINYPLAWKDPPEQDLFHFLYVTDRFAPGQGVTVHGVLDWDSCTPRYCEVKSVPGSLYPVWSPDGSRTLVMWSPDNAPIYRPDSWTASLIMFRGNGDGLPVAYLGSGLSPFWLDNETYGYVATGFDAREQVVAYRIGREEREVLAWHDDLARAWPGVERADHISIRRVIVAPVESGRVLLEASSVDGDDAYAVFALDRRTGEAARLPFRTRIRRYDFSPDGRWLAASGFDEQSTTRSVYVHDFEEQVTRTYLYDHAYATEPDVLSSVDWSADGQWLLLLSGGVLHLHAPTHDYHVSLVPEQPGCAFAAWVNR